MELSKEDKAEMIQELERLMGLDKEKTIRVHRKKVGDIEKFIAQIIVDLGAVGNRVCLYPIETVAESLIKKNEGTDQKRANALLRIKTACAIEWVEIWEEEVG